VICLSFEDIVFRVGEEELLSGLCVYVWGVAEEQKSLRHHVSELISEYVFLSFSQKIYTTVEHRMTRSINRSIENSVDQSINQPVSIHLAASTCDQPGRSFYFLSFGS